MSKEEMREMIGEAVRDAFVAHHSCVFNESERVMVRDLISVGQQVKRTFIWTVAAIITFSVGYVMYSLGIKQQ